ncbi:Asp23/Gls24 family envelope stress response protein [Amycolatopsis sp. NPDC051061]|uniref:Asp23/Gls24 family envelope stress response protein n=1 Tax=Amycolatopsis sp. NPDC051061 TaxID=3155042 RepID=UPI00342620BD
MSDVINSIFGRAQNETPSSEGYGYGTTATETVDADTTETETVEPAEDTAETETEDAVDETADAAEADDSADEDSAVEAEEDTTDEPSDEAVADEVAGDESAEDTDPADEAVAEETEAAEEVPVTVVAETEEAEEAGTRPAAGNRGSTTVADGVVSKIVIRVARKAEGVYELDEAGTSVEVDGEVATIAVTLVVEFGRAVKTLAEQIRIQVVEAVEQYLGLEVASVDVHVADIHFPDAD